MIKGTVVFIFIVFIFSISVLAQMRNGWRSIYDKEGRLTRMNYYERGKSVPDSNLFFQYYTENIPKGFVTGRIAPQVGCVDGSVSLFDQSGMLSSYHLKRNGELFFDVDCDYYGKCTSVWSDLFNVNSGFWACDSFSVMDSEFIIHNNQSVGTAVYLPEITMDLNQMFACRLGIPVEGNNARQGLALGWKNSDNYYLFEILFGKYYTVQYWDGGVYHALTEGRQTIERQSDDENIIVLKKNPSSLIFELNASIEMVLPAPDFKGEHVALVSRSRGNARFSDFVFKYDLPADDPFFKRHWIGKGSGFFISPGGKILTTYDAVMDAKNIRITGQIDGVRFTEPASIVRIDEENNMAVLQLDNKELIPFDALPFGYSNRAPVSDSKAFSIGFPNAISGIYIEPDVFEGKVLPSQASYAGYRLLEMSFRYGMNGAPVFDADANLIGVCAYKGLDLMSSEIIDFYSNSRLFIDNMGRFEQKRDSPLKEKSNQEKLSALSEIVVIVECSVFDL